MPKKAFLYTGILGLFGFFLTDFGPNFISQNNNGLPPQEGNIALITKGKTTILHVVSPKPSSFIEGAFLLIKNVEGMT